MTRTRGDIIGSPTASLLDELLPRFDVRIVQKTWVAAPPEAVFAAVKQVRALDVRLLAPLEALRSLPGRLSRRNTFKPASSLPLLEHFADGVIALGEREGAEIVAGAIGRFWQLFGNEPAPKLTTRKQFLAFTDPGYAKAAVSFVVLRDRAGSVVTTETRVLATSPDARRSFLRYWRMIRLGSVLIRRSWLAAIRRRATRNT